MPSQPNKKENQIIELKKKLNELENKVDSLSVRVEELESYKIVSARVNTPFRLVSDILKVGQKSNGMTSYK